MKLDVDFSSVEKFIESNQGTIQYLTKCVYDISIRNDVAQELNMTLLYLYRKITKNQNSVESVENYIFISLKHRLMRLLHDI